MRRCASAFIVLLVVLAGCGSDNSDNVSAILGVNGARVPAPTLVKAMNGLCTARQQASSAPDSAKATFFDDSHQALHDIAAALERTDRNASAALLIAKQRVEADLNAGQSTTLVADLDQLATVAHDSLDRLHVRAAPCPASP